MAAWIRNTPIPPVTRKQIEPDPVFRKLYRPLGAVAFVFADLEAELTRTIATLLGTTWREGAALEWLMQNANSRIELFYFLAMQATAPIVHGALTAALSSPRNLQRDQAAGTLAMSAEAIYKELQQSNADRNNLLHGSWTGLSQSDNSYSKNRLQAAAGVLKPLPVRGITVQLLNEETDYIISIHMRLADWSARLRRLDRPDLWPVALPGRFQLRSPLGKLIRENRKQAQRPPHAPSRRSPRPRRTPARS